MKTSPRTTLVVASLAGSLAVHAAVTACSSTKAEADVPASGASSCKKWQVQQVLPTGFDYTNVQYKNPDGTTGAVSLPYFQTADMPDGWEPYAASEFGAITVRRCVSQ
jgi:hypothetical protein